MNSGVYKFSSTIDNRCYIGSSVDLNRRKKRHFYDLKNNKHHNKHLQNFVNKYGIECLTYEVLEKCEDVLVTEQKYLNKLDNLFNASKSATAHFLNVKHTENSKRKISRKNSGKNNGMYGKTMSDIEKNRARKRFLGKPQSKELRLSRQLSTKRRKEILISKNKLKFHCISISHAASIIGAVNQSVSEMSRSKSKMCKGWLLEIPTFRLYTLDSCKNYRHMFDENLHPTYGLIEILTQKHLAELAKEEQFKRLIK